MRFLLKIINKIDKIKFFWVLIQKMGPTSRNLCSLQVYKYIRLRRIWGQTWNLSRITPFYGTIISEFLQENWIKSKRPSISIRIQLWWIVFYYIFLIKISNLASLTNKKKFIFHDLARNFLFPLVQSFIIQPLFLVAGKTLFDCFFSKITMP